MDRVFQALELINLYNKDVLNQDNLMLKDIKIPNFFKLTSKIERMEICHQIVELYEEYVLLDGLFDYESENIRIQPNDIIFDCGACVGLTSAYAASKGAQVYAFEPNKDAVKLLELTRDLYPNNIHIINKAISNNSTSKLFIKRENIGAGNFNKNSNPHILITGSEMVECVSIDEFIKETGIIPTFIKADIEGEETNLILGAENCLSKYAPKIVISLYHTTNNINNLILLSNNEYVVDKISDFQTYIYKKIN